MAYRTYLSRPVCPPKIFDTKGGVAFSLQQRFSATAKRRSRIEESGTAERGWRCGFGWCLRNACRRRDVPDPNPAVDLLQSGHSRQIWSEWIPAVLIPACSVSGSILGPRISAMDTTLPRRVFRHVMRMIWVRFFTLPAAKTT